MYKFVRIFLFLAILPPVYASPRLHTVKRYFELTNISEYPGFTFYFLYQTYPYHTTYQKGPQVRMEVGQELPYSTSDYFDGTYLEAVDAEGHHYRSNITVGGRLVTMDPNLERVEDLYRIVSIENGIIHLQLISEFAPSPDGSIRESDGGIPGFIVSPGKAGGMTMFTAPIVFGCVVALFMVMRSRFVRRMGQ